MDQTLTIRSMILEEGVVHTLLVPGSQQLSVCLRISVCKKQNRRQPYSHLDKS